MDQQSVFNIGYVIAVFLLTISGILILRGYRIGFILFQIFTAFIGILTIWQYWDVFVSAFNQLFS